MREKPARCTEREQRARRHSYLGRGRSIGRLCCVLRFLPSRAAAGRRQWQRNVPLPPSSTYSSPKKKETRNTADPTYGPTASKAAAVAVGARRHNCVVMAGTQALLWKSRSPVYRQRVSQAVCTYIVRGCLSYIWYVQWERKRWFVGKKNGEIFPIIS